MTELAWFSEYSGQSTVELIDLAGRFRVDSLVLAFEEALGQKAFRTSGYDALSCEERTVLAVEALEREVNNGGYNLFFLNSDEWLVNEVVGALTRIGRNDIAQLTARAIGLRDSVDELEYCDRRYFELAVDLSLPTFDFIKQAKDQIRLP